MNQRPDYGPKGCCAPAAAAMLVGFLAVLAGLVMWVT